MRAFAYIRVSTGEQAKKHSLEAQKDEIERFCAENDIQVLEWFEDHTSGKKLVEREGLMEMLDRAGAAVDLVVATESDRISRDMFQFGWVDTHLSMQGVKLRIINERPAETPMEKAFQKIRAVFSEFETDLRQWRVNRGRAQAKAKNQFMNRPPLGYVIRSGRIVVDDEAMEQVEEMFRRYVAGESMAAIGRSLGKSRRSVSYVLGNRFYVDAGLHGEHTVFLDAGLFEQAQEPSSARLGRATEGKLGGDGGRSDGG